MATTSIDKINAIAIARGTSEPSNTDVLWLDESITGTVYERLKYYDLDSGSWGLVQRNANQILEDLKTVDGSGSGLDANTLEGYTAAELMLGGGSVPALSVGQLLVGQGDTIGTAQTVGGIATINATGDLVYVVGSISHTDLADIGTNTHAQIDTHIADTANPHGVTAAQVGNTTAQWNADRIEGNITNIGTLGAGQDGYALTWDNATSRFVMAEAGAGASIYTADDTIGSGRIATLTDTLTFKKQPNINALFIEQEVHSASDTSSLIHMESQMDNSTNQYKFITGQERGTGQNYFELTSKGDVNNSSNLGLGFYYSNAKTQGVNYSYVGITTTNKAFQITVEESTRNIFKLYSGTGNITGRGYLQFRNYNDSADRIFLTRTGKNFINPDNVFETDAGLVVMGENYIGSEIISLQGRTAVQGADTLLTSTAFQIYDGDTTPSSLWDFRNNGDIYAGKSSTLDINNKTLTFETGTSGQVLINRTGSNATPLFKAVGYTASGTTPYFNIGQYGEVDVLARLNSYAFKVYDHNGNATFNTGGLSGNTFIGRSSGQSTVITGVNTSSYATEQITDSTYSFHRWYAGGVRTHSINLNTSSPSPGVYFYENGITGTNKVILGGSALINSESISLQDDTLVKGSTTTSAVKGFEVVDSANASKFEVRNNGDLYTNGSKGLSNTYTFGGGGSGDIASMTFTNGILTAVTTVP